MNWSWLMPEPASTFGAGIDSIYYIILWITGAIFVLVETALIVFIIRYRHREGRVAVYTHGSKKAEIVWTVIPFFLVLFIVYASNDIWLEVKRADQGGAPANALPLRVVAKQFEWNVTYPGPDGELDTADDFVKRNQLHVPIGRAVRIDLGSEDVIHSFFLPDFRVKQDAVPGMTIPVWFEATRTGEFPMACAELCGLGHYRMRASLTVHEVDDFDRWQAAEIAAGGLPTGDSEADAERGEDSDIMSEGEESA
jgi:cytochrome c oxidase subunit 2